MEIITFISAHLVEILMAVSSIAAGLVVLAKLTPSQNDDVIIGKVQKYVDAALDFLKSKNR